MQTFPRVAEYKHKL